MAAEKKNPCSFKRICKECRLTSLPDRPFMCQDLQCEHFTPCKRCQNNMTLDEQGLCSNCVKNGRQQNEQVQSLTSSGDLIEVAASHHDLLEEDGFSSGGVPFRTLTITSPGFPPQEYSEMEKEYYQQQWKEYQGFYRDPTTKAICHNIIILEVELNWTISTMISQRGKVSKDLEKRRNQLIRNLRDMRDQLPSKEATQESDDERFFSMVYDSYVQEKKERVVGKVTRIFSPEALALAPVLTFPIDPLRILRNLGYKAVDAAQACNHIMIDDLPKEPEKMLEFLGFFLRETYALPLNSNVNIEEDEAVLPSAANLSVGNIEQTKTEDHG